MEFLMNLVPGLGRRMFSFLLRPELFCKKQIKNEHGQKPDLAGSNSLSICKGC